MLWVLLLASLPLAAQNGKAIFDGKGDCLRCHSIHHRGGSLGPDLTEIGLQRSAASLRTSIVDPDAEIFREYLTVVVTTAGGDRIEGIALNEDDLSIQVREAQGNPRSFLKQNLKDVHREERSLMPSYAGRLSAVEITKLVEYLQSLKVPASPRRAHANPGRSPPMSTGSRGRTATRRNGRNCCSTAWAFARDPPWSIWAPVRAISPHA
jgi:putative heme-binding domain-containing protein